MKKLLLIVAAFIVSLSISAQGKSGEKGKNKDKKNVSVNQNKKNSDGKQKDKVDKDDKEDKENKVDKQKKDHESKVWDGTHKDDNDGPKASKNQPAKVRAAFQRDYPNAQNVTWSKYRGDWTATFRNGLFMSTAVYHANGDRRDTRTPIARKDLPGTVFDSIFKRRPETRLDDIIRIQVPNVVKDIFRVKDIVEGKTQYLFFNSDGTKVQYSY